MSFETIWKENYIPEEIIPKSFTEEWVPRHVESHGELIVGLDPVTKGRGRTLTIISLYGLAHIEQVSKDMFVLCPAFCEGIIGISLRKKSDGYTEDKGAGPSGYILGEEDIEWFVNEPLIHPDPNRVKVGPRLVRDLKRRLKAADEDVRDALNAAY